MPKQIDTAALILNLHALRMVKGQQNFIILSL